MARWRARTSISSSLRAGTTTCASGVAARTTRSTCPAAPSSTCVASQTGEPLPATLAAGERVGLRLVAVGEVRRLLLSPIVAGHGLVDERDDRVTVPRVAELVVQRVEL